MFVLSALLSGLVFGLGLIVSGMANPAKVLGFLDLAGAWDPSLALVMAGAITVGFFAFLIAKKRTRSFIGAEMKLPTASAIDQRLLTGSALFGAGWGMAGFCPGPVLVALGIPTTIQLLAQHSHTLCHARIVVPISSTAAKRRHTCSKAGVATKSAPSHSPLLHTHPHTL